MEKLFDVCVVGAGVEGSSTARYLVSRGKKTLLLEQASGLFDDILTAAKRWSEKLGTDVPRSKALSVLLSCEVLRTISQPRAEYHPTDHSHGQSRICRYGYPETYYAALMPEAFQMWNEIEKASNTKLFRAVGCLSLEEPPYSDISRTANCVRQFGNECQLLNGNELRRRFPMLKFPPEVSASFEPTSGMLFADKCLKALQEQFVEMGGVLCEGEKVLEILPGPVVSIRTSKGSYRAKNVIMTAGPWTNQLLRPLGLVLPLTPWRIQVCYWEIEKRGMYSADNGFPCFIFIAHDNRHVYGLPEHEYPGYIKICAHEGVPASADRRDDVRGEEKFIKLPASFIRDFTIGINPEPGIVEYCMYTATPDSDFILDRHPRFKNIVIGAGFSGHGFKMAPVIGKILSQLALGERVSYDISPFRSSRFDNAAVKSTL